MRRGRRRPSPSRRRPTITLRQPCSIAAAISWPVPWVVAVSGSLSATSASPLARAISTTPVPSSSAAHVGLDRGAVRARDGERVQLSRRAREDRVERALASVGERQGAARAARALHTPAESGRRLGGREAAAELVGAAEDRCGRARHGAASARRRRPAWPCSHPAGARRGGRRAGRGCSRGARSSPCPARSRPRARCVGGPAP